MCYVWASMIITRKEDTFLPADLIGAIMKAWGKTQNMHIRT